MSVNVQVTLQGPDARTKKAQVVSRYVPMARRHERNALADEDGNDMDVELIDLAGVEERGDQLSTTHHPDVFSRRRAQTPRKRLHRLRYEFHPWRHPFLRLPREDVVRELRVEHPVLLTFLLVIGEKPVVGLASPQDGVVVE